MVVDIGISGEMALELGIVGSPQILNLFGKMVQFWEQWVQCGGEACCKIEEGKRRMGSLMTSLHVPRKPLRPFAALSHEQFEPKHVLDVALSTEDVAKTLKGATVYTVSNANNEFVLISDPNGQSSFGLLFFRQEDAESLLAQVQLRQPVLGKGARVVPITLDQVYLLKVEGIAFRFLPDRSYTNKKRFGDQ